MDYQLAKQLKEAGFKQGAATGNHHDGGKWIDEDNKPYDHEGGIGDECYVPTLDELVEACGDKFSKLEWMHSGNNQDKWRATTDPDSAFPYQSGIADTPDAAVALLWLALNTKGA